MEKCMRSPLVALALIAVTALPASAQENCSTMRITAYAANDLPGQMRNGRLTGPNVGTAVAVGVTAAGAPLIPLGTALWIEGIGQRIVMDTGLGGPGWLDVLMQSHGEAMAHGVRSLTVCR